MFWKEVYSMSLREDILNSAKAKNINPYIKPFKPSDLDLNSNDYGSFSDYCAPTETVSGQYNEHTFLKVAQWRGDKPYRYLLLF
jgi:hypothetical protein